MRASEWLWPTLKESPNDAEIISHQLMLRAGLIRKLGSGLYTWLPLGLKILRKVENIIREEMSRIHAMEILMPAIIPAELWEETGRWKSFGGQLLKMQDSNGRNYCFGPTHEEVITDLCRRELHSYKQLPANFYQIQTKFRDEIRPRFGVMRAREFIMKDAYSFHLSKESLQDTYHAMYNTYCRILNRLGLQYRVVEADTGAIGGHASHEFQVLAEAGEDLLFYSDTSDYAANVEQAKSWQPSKAETTLNKEELTLIETPQQKTIAEVAAFLQTDPAKIIKTLIVLGKDDSLIALVLCGDDTLNPIKAIKHPWLKSPLQFADEKTIMDKLGVSQGFVGPIGLKIPIIADHAALAMPSFICGGNIVDQHYLNASWERDANYNEAFDLRMVKEGDRSPDGKGVLRSCRGIEVGHIFQLGEKYAQAMNASVINAAGKAQILSMGCYGLGVSRIVAAAIEQHHDDKGIKWPINIAPFQVVIIPINKKNSALVAETAEAIYQQCLSLGLEVIIEDRDERPGVVFAEYDLLGIPHRLVISERSLKKNVIEYKARDAMAVNEVAVNEFVSFLKKIICSA